MDVTIVVATFGGRRWEAMGARVAEDAKREAPAIHCHVHAGTLAQARNAAIAQVETEWVIHLDADDALEEGFVEAMREGHADVRAPRVRYVPPGNAEPIMPKVYGHTHTCGPKCLRYGNWLVIGSMVRTELVRSIGWEEFGWSEDWAMWARCWRAGASFEQIPKAIYRAHRSRGSRNRVRNSVGVKWHAKIEAAVWPDEASVL